MEVVVVSCRPGVEAAEARGEGHLLFRPLLAGCAVGLGAEGFEVAPTEAPELEGTLDVPLCEGTWVSEGPGGSWLGASALPKKPVR